MKETTSSKATQPLDAYTYKDVYVSDEEMEKWKNSPEIKAIHELYERLRNGTATEDERIDFEIECMEREIDHNILRG